MIAYKVKIKTPKGELVVEVSADNEAGAKHGAIVAAKNEFRRTGHVVYSNDLEVISLETM